MCWSFSMGQCPSNIFNHNCIIFKHYYKSFIFRQQNCYISQSPALWPLCKWWQFAYHNQTAKIQPADQLAGKRQHFYSCFACCSTTHIVQIWIKQTQNQDRTVANHKNIFLRKVIIFFSPHENRCQKLVQRQLNPLPHSLMVIAEIYEMAWSTHNIFQLSK